MFNLSYLGFPLQLHSQRVAAIILIIYGVICNNSKTINNFQSEAREIGLTKYVLFCIVLLCVGLLQIQFIGIQSGSSFFDTMLNICIFTIPTIWSITKIFNNVNQFMRVLIYVGLLQSLFIVFSLINESFALFLDMTFNDVLGGDYSSGHRGGGMQAV